MHPIVRSAVAKYPKAYALGKEACNEVLEQVKTANRNVYIDPDRLTRELDDNLDRIRRDARTSDRDTLGLSYVISACGGYTAPPKLDPDFLIAWEEGMVRPIPWVIKSSLVTILIEFDNPSSIPSLGELLRQAVGILKVEPENYDPVEFACQDALRALFKFTNKEAARELSEIVRITPIEKRRVLLRIGGNLDQPAWQKVLNELEGDPSMREHRERLLHVIEESRASIRASPAKTKGGSESLGLPYKLGYKSGATESE